MIKKFSDEFKQQSVDYTLSNAHLSLAEIANHLGVGHLTIDKWVRQLASNKVYYLFLLNDFCKNRLTIKITKHVNPIAKPINTWLVLINEPKNIIKR